jgi:excisionase family DNA binding protein
MPVTERKKWFSLQEGAAYTGLSVETLRRFIDKGRLTAHLAEGMARPILLRREQLDALFRPTAAQQRGE